MFEEKTGIVGGPTEVMRTEHRLIGQYLEEIHEEVKKQDPDSDRQEANLLNALSAHNQKEEQILYPMIDRSTDEAERASVFST